MNIPPHERDAFRRFLERNQQIFDTDSVAEHYRSTSHHVLPSPFGTEVSSHIAKALRNRHPFSVVRIGDGEANMLTFGGYPETQILDEFAVASIVAMQDDRFRIAEPWQVVLRTMMHAAIASADIVGVPGLWRPGYANVDNTMELFTQDPRGVSGYWRGIDHMMSMGEQSLLTGKIITSAHLYFGVLEHLETIVRAARRIVCVTNRESAFRRLRKSFPDCQFDSIDAVLSTSEDHSSPVFFSEMSRRLGRNLSSVLFLVGAGPWSEIYCTWIKERRGVAVDIGSAFEILAGNSSRPIHKHVSLERIFGQLNLDLPEFSNEGR